MTQTLRIIGSFVERDLRRLLSYRFALLMQCGAALVYLLVFFYIAKVFDPMASPYLAAYGGDYFAFVLIGIGFMSFCRSAMTSYAADIRSGQMLGTLEAMMATPVRSSLFLVGSSFSNFGLAAFRIVLYILAGVFLFGLRFEGLHGPAAILILVLAVIAFSGLGVLSASCILAFKKGDPVTLAVNASAALLGGVFFPIEVLPSWLASVSACLPITYALRAMRTALFQGATWSDVGFDILVLTAFAVVLPIAAVASFRAALARARREGSLAQY